MQNGIAIGTPAYHPAYSKLGHVAKVDAPAARTFLIGGNGLQQDRAELTIVWENLDMVTVGDNLARSWVDRAEEYRVPPITVEEAAERLAAAQAKQIERQETAKRDREDAARSRREFEEDAAKRLPAWAQAVIVAELIENQSDSMTDYFGHTTRRRVILAFSAHKRSLFPEMRKAAANFAETAHLVDAPAKAEHRENYSMGGGTFLKAEGGQHASGWQIKKQTLFGDAVKSLPTAEWSLAPVTAPKAEAAPAASVDGIRIEEHTHTKKGFAMFICILPGRVERDEFDRLNEMARSAGGWYSRPWGGTPGGFAFKKREVAEAFAGSSTTAEPAMGAATSPAPATPRADVGDKLRALADKMQADIDHKLADRLINTPKRQLEAGSARIEGHRLKRTQTALRALATQHDAGTVPAELRNIRSKAAAYELLGSIVDRSRAGYYDAGIDTGKPSKDTAEARALWALVDAPSATERDAEELRRKVQALQFAKIPGYFPTPMPVIETMIFHADMPASEFDMLEPNGGSAAILDAVQARFPAARLTTYEPWESLREVLTLKGYQLAGADFLEAATAPRFDRVLMNPPFENGQDMDHVGHAYSMLRPGGRLVSVMSPGPFFRQDRKARKFRDWFEARGGEKFELPAGSFKESGTGVGTVLVVLDA